MGNGIALVLRGCLKRKGDIIDGTQKKRYIGFDTGPSAVKDLLGRKAILQEKEQGRGILFRNPICERIRKRKAEARNQGGSQSWQAAFLIFTAVYLGAQIIRSL